MPRSTDSPRKPRSSAPQRTSSSYASRPLGIDPALEYAENLLRACGVSTRCVETRAIDSPASEWARSGAMWLTGDAEAPPQFANAPLASLARALGVALATLAPHSPLAGLDAPALLAERAALAGLARRGRVSAGGSARLLETREGWIVANLPRADDWQLVPAWLETTAAPMPPDAWNDLTPRIAAQRADRLVDRGRLLGLAIAHAPAGAVPIRTRGAFRLLHATEASAPREIRPLRLLDLSNLWAGPLAASLLAMSGIEVLKVENPGRPDGARNGPAAFFDLMHGNKQGCALDLQDTPDRATFERLLECADIVLESARPRGLEQLGYDAASWVTARPGRLWVSITGYGRATPEREWIAYGDDAAVAAGLAWPLKASAVRSATGRPTPRFCGDAIADPLTGLHAAALTLAHLHAGRGGILDVSLFDVCVEARRLDSGPLVLPIERSRRGSADRLHDAGGFVCDRERVRIEMPRARRATGSAPVLAAPDASLLSRWSPGC